MYAILVGLLIGLGLGGMVFNMIDDGRRSPAHFLGFAALLIAGVFLARDLLIQ